MENDPARIHELEKYIPVMSDEERDTYFLCVTNVLPLNFSPEQESNREKKLKKRNDKIQTRFDDTISRN